MVRLVCVCGRRRNRGRECESGRERRSGRVLVGAERKDGCSCLKLPHMLKKEAKIQQRQRNTRVTRGRILVIICGEAEKTWQCLLK